MVRPAGRHVERRSGLLDELAQTLRGNRAIDDFPQCDVCSRFGIEQRHRLSSGRDDLVHLRNFSREVCGFRHGRGDIGMDGNAIHALVASRCKNLAHPRDEISCATNTIDLGAGIHGMDLLVNSLGDLGVVLRRGAAQICHRLVLHFIVRNMPLISLRQHFHEFSVAGQVGEPTKSAPFPDIHSCGRRKLAIPHPVVKGPGDQADPWGESLRNGPVDPRVPVPLILRGFRRDARIFSPHGAMHVAPMGVEMAEIYRQRVRPEPESLAIGIMEAKFRRAFRLIALPGKQKVFLGREGRLIRSDSHVIDIAFERGGKLHRDHHAGAPRHSDLLAPLLGEPGDLTAQTKVIRHIAWPGASAQNLKHGKVALRGILSDHIGIESEDTRHDIRGTLRRLHACRIAIPPIQREPAFAFDLQIVRHGGLQGDGLRVDRIRQRQADGLFARDAQAGFLFVPLDLNRRPFSRKRFFERGGGDLLAGFRIHQ